MLKRVLNPCGIIRVQSWGGEALPPSAVTEILGIDWLQKTGAVMTGRADVICSGPTDGLVIVPDSETMPWVQRLEEAFRGSAFRATNVSDALIRIQVQGPEVRDLLAKGCSLDLHPRLFPPCRAARTRFAGMPVIVRCTGMSTFELIVTQSYGDFLLSWLEDAVLEFSGATM